MNTLDFESKTMELTEIPILLFQSDSQKTYYTFDWGCKIHENGTFTLNFFGAQEFTAMMPIAKETKTSVQFVGFDGEQAKRIIPWGNFVSDMQKTMRDLLSKEIQKIKTEIPLSQKQITGLLEKMKEVFGSYFKGGSSFFLSDYSLNKEQMTETILPSVTQMKEFALHADGTTTIIEIKKLGF